VGRDAQAATDISMRAELLTWSRSRGLFAGIDLNGATVSQNVGDTDELYGGHDRFGPVLRGEVPPPPDAERFLHAVGRYFGEAEMHR
jgi:lipid-binding SYLF domain-containing protein